MAADIHPPIRREQLNDVLRYWLNAVRLEDALSARPKANRITRHMSLNLKQPEGIQPYFKLPLSPTESGFALRDEERVDTEISGEKIPFTAQWLRRMYRRSKRWSSLDTVFTGMTGWPTVYFPRSEELATLFRFRTHLEWFDHNGDRFEPPRYKDRKAGRYPPPPERLKVSSVDDAVSGLLPYSLDDRLLTRSLGIADEELADLYDILRAAEDLTPSQMVATVLDCISHRSDWVPQLKTPSDLSFHDLIKYAVEVVKNALGQGRSQPAVYGVGLVYDSAQIQTTHHLQKDLSVAVNALKLGELTTENSALEMYLQRRPQKTGWKPVMGQFDPNPLTEEQRRVAEAFWGSTLVAVQGPPGTGKTRLIIDLGAAHLVSRIRDFADTGVMGSSVLMVSSTNNRAVDNVCDVFQDRDIPLALRSGSQNVTATQTVTALQRVVDYLERLPARSAEDDQVLLDAELASFKTMEEALFQAEKERHALMANAEDKRRIESRIKELESVVTWSTDEKPFDRQTGKVHKRILDRLMPALSILLRQLEQGEELIKARQQWQKVRSRFGEQIKKIESEVPTLEWASLQNVSFTSEETDRDAWAERIEDLIQRVADLREDLEDALRMERLRADLLDLKRTLQDLSIPLDPQVDESIPDIELARRHHRLFIQAETIRRTWFSLHRSPLLKALKTALETASTRRSLKRLFQDNMSAGRWLRQAFPVMGSTLLSLGNVFPARVQQFQQLVIDEGGQCHPAYAVSGLLRAESALIIGDVHQLEPVVHLSEEDETRVRKAARLTLSLDELGPYRVGLGRPNSAQSIADECMEERPSLDVHFRCHEDIIKLSDELCGYGLNIKTPPAGDLPVEALHRRVHLIPTQGSQERLRGSWFNQAEVETSIRLLSTLNQHGVLWKDMAVITPYVGQLDTLRYAMRQARIPYQGAEMDEFSYVDDGVAVGTVHRFQGGERRFVLLSTVVTQPRSLTFLNQRVNLVNVAVSRAREQFLIIGDESTLLKGEFTKILVEYGSDTIGSRD